MSDSQGRRPNEIGPTGKQVSANLHRLRTTRGLTVRELARRLTDNHGRSWTPGAVSRVESGQRRVDADDLMALALALNVAPTALLLPPDAEGETQITGAAGPLPSAHVWRWADGQWPLTWSTDPEELRRQLMDFHLTSRPAGLAPYHSADDAAEKMRLLRKTPFD
ncbi:helix-turn-helix domain-containing protein [Salinactinospora qingdaonensis]